MPLLWHPHEADDSQTEANQEQLQHMPVEDTVCMLSPQCVVDVKASNPHV